MDILHRFMYGSGLFKAVNDDVVVNWLLKPLILKSIQQ